MVCSSSRFGLLLRTRGGLASTASTAAATSAATSACTTSAPTSLLDNLLFWNTERKKSIAGQIAPLSLHLVVNNETQERKLNGLGNYVFFRYSRPFYA
jgi:hypothetical protein